MFKKFIALYLLAGFLVVFSPSPSNAASASETTGVENATPDLILQQNRNRNRNRRWENRRWRNNRNKRINRRENRRDDRRDDRRNNRRRSRN